MKQIDRAYLCRALVHLSGVPTRIFEGETLLESVFPIPLPRDPMAVCRAEVLAVREHVGYYMTPRFYCYGVINAGAWKIVVGPTAQITPGDRALRELAFQADVPEEETAAFVDGMKQITRAPLEALLSLLCTVNYLLCGEKLELEDVAIHGAEQEAIKSRVERNRTAKVYETERPQTMHNTLQLEETLMDLVRRGDSAALRKWLSAAPPVRAGVLAADQLRQLRNTFIVSATLTSRAAIRGGLNAEDALSLSDAFIQRAEQLTEQSAILNLQYNMILAFTEQVAKVRRGTVSLVCGFCADKDVDGFFRTMSPWVRRAWCVPIPNPRSLAPDAAVAKAVRFRVAAEPCASFAEALPRAEAAARAEGGPVFVCGSLFLVGEALEFLALAGK